MYFDMYMYIYFGPQTALERVYSAAGGAPPTLCTSWKPELRRGVCDAFYSLGTFVMLAQARAT